MTFCGKCGKPLGKNISFCPGCGAGVAYEDFDISKTTYLQLMQEANAHPAQLYDDSGRSVRRHLPFILVTLTLVVVIATVAFAVMLSGGDGDIQLVGRWNSTDIWDNEVWIEFNADGSIASSHDEIRIGEAWLTALTWETQDGILWLHSGDIFSARIEYTIAGDRLIFDINGNVTVFNRAMEAE